MSSKMVYRNQSFLLPADVDEWIPSDHPARFVLAFVQELDLVSLGIQAGTSPIGAPSYPTEVLLACWLYGFMDHKRSSRALERACRESLPYMWLAGLLQPDHVTLWRFYDSNRSAMKGLFRQTVRLAVKVGLVDFALQCVDGTKIPVGSNDTLRRRGAVQKLLTAVDAEIAAMEQREGSSEPPAKSAQRHKARAKKEEMRQRVRTALGQIEAEAQPEPAEKGKEPVAYTTDPEARLMKTRHGWAMGYNAQAMVDSKAQIIVAADVTQQNYDCDQLIPLLEQIEQEYGYCAAVTLADNGYCSVANLAAADGHTDLYTPDKGFAKRVQQDQPYDARHFIYHPEEDLLICPQGRSLTFVRDVLDDHKRRRCRQYQCHACDGCPVRAQCTTSRHGRTVERTENASLLDAHRRKMSRETAKTLMKWRAALIESVFGTLKERQAAQRFLMRSLNKVKQEWYLLCAAFNLRKLYRDWVQKRTLAPTTA